MDQQLAQLTLRPVTPAMPPLSGGSFGSQQHTGQPPKFKSLSTERVSTPLDAVFGQSVVDGTILFAVTLVIAAVISVFTRKLAGLDGERVEVKAEYTALMAEYQKACAAVIATEVETASLTDEVAIVNAALDAANPARAAARKETANGNPSKPMGSDSRLDDVDIGRGRSSVGNPTERASKPRDVRPGILSVAQSAIVWVYRLLSRSNSKADAPARSEAIAARGYLWPLKWLTSAAGRLVGRAFAWNRSGADDAIDTSAPRSAIYPPAFTSNLQSAFASCPPAFVPAPYLRRAADAEAARDTDTDAVPNAPDAPKIVS